MHTFISGEVEYTTMIPIFWEKYCTVLIGKEKLTWSQMKRNMLAQVFSLLNDLLTEAMSACVNFAKVCQKEFHELLSWFSSKNNPTPTLLTFSPNHYPFDILTPTLSTFSHPTLVIPLTFSPQPLSFQHFHPNPYVFNSHPTFYLSILTPTLSFWHSQPNPYPFNTLTPPFSFQHSYPIFFLSTHPNLFNIILTPTLILSTPQPFQHSNPNPYPFNTLTPPFSVQHPTFIPLTFSPQPLSFQHSHPNPFNTLTPPFSFQHPTLILSTFSPQPVSFQHSPHPYPINSPQCLSFQHSVSFCNIYIYIYIYCMSF